MSKQLNFGVSEAYPLFSHSDDLRIVSPAMAVIPRNIPASEECLCLVSIPQALIASPLHGLISAILEEVLAVCRGVDAELKSDALPANKIPAEHGMEERDDSYGENLVVL